MNSGSISDNAQHETDCPTGQVALSVVFQNLAVTNLDYTAVPNVVNGAPVGYFYASRETGGQYEAWVTCANAS